MESLPAPNSPSQSSSADFLRQLMRRYQSAHLVGTTPAAFRERIEAMLQLSDHRMEGFADPDKQRDLTIQFTWGHNHDFGDFALQGRMGDRHVHLLKTFMDDFGGGGNGALPRDLTGQRILDIGCWTGGASLLMAAMGAKVTSIDEVKKYVDALDYLRSSFGLGDRIVPRNLSLYECTLPEFQDAFDTILFAGVLYHVSDPILALRLVFNMLKDGGTMLFETLGLDTPEQLLRYHGPTHFAIGESKEKGKRGGWNWFVPSASALEQMMIDVGFVDVQVQALDGSHRLHAVARRERHVDLMRSGLSVRDVR